MNDLQMACKALLQMHKPTTAPYDTHVVWTRKAEIGCSAVDTLDLYLKSKRRTSSLNFCYTRKAGSGRTTMKMKFHLARQVIEDHTDNLWLFICKHRRVRSICASYVAGPLATAHGRSFHS